jgi:hypothetical protein
VTNGWGTINLNTTPKGTGPLAILDRESVQYGARTLPATDAYRSACESPINGRNVRSRFAHNRNGFAEIIDVLDVNSGRDSNRIAGYRCGNGGLNGREIAGDSPYSLSLNSNRKQRRKQH